MLAREGMVRVFVVHDIGVYRQALIHEPGKLPILEVLGGGARCPSTVARVSQLVPDVILVPAGDASGADGLRAFSAAAPAAKLPVVGLAETEQEVLAYAEAGMSGYITPEASIAQLAATLSSVISGSMPVPPEITGALLRRLRARVTSSDSGAALSTLTVRETQIAQLVSEGLSNKEIAARLSIEVRTVKNHIHRILSKLRVTNRGAVMHLILAEGRPQVHRH